jgi:hypothetical protein
MLNEVMTFRTAKEANKTPRFDWKNLLGRPLRDWCYRQFAAGLSPRYCLNFVMGKLQEYYDRKMWLHQDVQFIQLGKAQENARIGVAAAHSEYKRVRKHYYGI